MQLLNNGSSDTIVDEPKTEIKKETTYESLLTEYGQPANVEEKQSDDTGTNVSEKTPDTNSEGNADNWKGNSAYYQTGTKVGQLRKSPAKKTVTYEPEKETFGADELITGALFLSLVDLLFPLLICGLHNYFTRKNKDRVKIEWTNVSLTGEQRKQLTPIADKAVRQLKLHLNPALALVLTMAGLYGVQYATALMEAKLKAGK